MSHASKTPDESGNYNHSVRVTYRLGISITCIPFRSVAESRRSNSNLLSLRKSQYKEVMSRKRAKRL